MKVGGMSRSARALRSVTAFASLMLLLGLALIAHPLLASYESSLEMAVGLAGGTIVAILGAYDLIAVARGNVETLVWRSVLPAAVGIAVAVSPVFGYSTVSYAAGTVAAGVAVAGVALASGWFAANVALPLPRFPRSPA